MINLAGVFLHLSFCPNSFGSKIFHLILSIVYYFLLSGVGTGEIEHESIHKSPLNAGLSIDWWIVYFFPFLVPDLDTPRANQPKPICKALRGRHILGFTDSDF